MDAKDCFVGDECVAKRGILKVKSAVEFGRVANWNDFEKVLHHAFYDELRCTPEEHAVMFAESPLSPPKDRMKIVEVIFETFNVLMSFLAVRQALSLFAHGQTQGVVLDSGLDVTVSVPIRDGNPVLEGATEANLGGALVSQHLVDLICERGYEMTTTSEKMIVNDIKEAHCYVAGDWEEERLRFEATGFSDAEYELPDGSILPISSDRFVAPEILFQPEVASKWRLPWKKRTENYYRGSYLRTRLLGEAQVGIHQLVRDSIAQVDVENPLESDLWRDLVVCGGNSLLSGFSERLSIELTKLGAPSVMNVSVPDNRDHLSWLGGSLLSNLSSFDRSWITKDEYDEFGSEIVLEKCF